MSAKGTIIAARATVLGIAVIGAAVALTIFFLKKDIVDAKNSAGTAVSTTGPANSEEDFF